MRERVPLISQAEPQDAAKTLDDCNQAYLGEVHLLNDIFHFAWLCGYMQATKELEPLLEQVADG